jgi:Condensation domain/Phosphopantetheine attachment site
MTAGPTAPARPEPTPSDPTPRDAGQPAREIRVAPLSPAQERVWFVDAAAVGNPTYNVPLFVRTNQEIDPDALAGALEVVVGRHEILRTTYRLDEHGPVQVVRVAGAVPVRCTDLRGYPDPARQARVEAEELAREPFDLTTGPVLRAVVWQGIPDGDAVLLLLHHIAVDGWSLAPLFEELVAAYEAARSGSPVSLAPLPQQYADVAVAEREAATSPAVRELVRRRAAELATVHGGLKLAGCRAGAVGPDGGRPGAQREFAIPAGVAALARSLRVTPFVVLGAAVQVLIRQWSGRREFLLGVMTANRQAVEHERLVGFFVNTVPLHCAVEPGQTFRQLCGRVTRDAYGALGQQRLPYEQLTTSVAARRGSGREPLVDIGFVLQNTIAPAVTGWAPPVVLGTGTAKFDVLFMVDDGPTGYALTIEYDTDRYPDQAIVELGEGFARLLAAVLTDADASINELPGGPLSFQVPAPTVPPPGDRGSDAAVPVSVAGPGSGAVPGSVAGPGSGAVPGSVAGPGGVADGQLAAAELFTATLATSPWLTPPPADQLGPDADFFVLGGHSLLAVTMLAQAQRSYGVVIPPRAFLAEPTVAGLARLLAPTGGAPVVAGPDRVGSDATTPAETGPLIPASPVQQRFWTIDRIPSQRRAYLLPSVVEYQGPVDRGVLVRAVDWVLARHPALRSRFVLDRRRRQVCYHTDAAPATAEPLDATDWSAEELREHLAEACWSGFDLATDAPVRAEVLTLNGPRTLLVLVMHHIVADGWSRRLLMAEIADTYRRLTAPDAAAAPPPRHPADGAAPNPATPADHAAPSPDRLDAVLGRLRGAPTDIALPHDRPRGEVQTTIAGTGLIRLGTDLTARLRQVTQASGCTTFMTAAALLAVTLTRRGAQRDFLFAFPWAGRDDARAAQAVGMFVNTLVLRVDLTAVASWRDVLGVVRESSMFAYRHADVPYDAIAAALHPDRDLRRPALTTVYLSAEEGRDQPAALDGTTAHYLELDPLHLKYELELVATELGDDVELALSYAVDLFDPASVTALLDGLVAAARDLASDLDAHPLEEFQ